MIWKKPKKYKKKKLNEMTKNLCVAYGAIRMVDEMTIECELPEVMEFLIGMCRATLSDVIFPNLDDDE